MMAFMSRRLMVILAIGSIALAWGWLDGPAARQKRGIKAAENFMEQMEPTLAADSRFAAVTMSVMTHPSLHVHGEVPDEQALQDLKRMVVLPANAKFQLGFRVDVKAAATRPTQ